MPTYLIFDIETVPDLTLWRPPVEEVLVEPPALPTAAAPPTAEATPTEKPKRSRAKKVTALKEPKEHKEPFAPLYAHRPIAIGYVWLDENFGLKSFGCIGTSTYKEDEKRLLTDWNAFIARERPVLITWNGRTFDIPVIALRCFRWGVPQVWSDKEYRYRYGDQHIDLFDVMTDYGAMPRTGFHLDNLCTILGLPTKDGIDGSKVNGLFKQGAIDTIETYCLTDALKTAYGALRFFLLRGRVSVELYNEACANLYNACKATPKLEAFAAATNGMRLIVQP
jgi:predicted PolB exonuclease-like 3'-5' exonuclease